MSNFKVKQTCVEWKNNGSKQEHIYLYSSFYIKKSVIENGTFQPNK